MTRRELFTALLVAPFIPKVEKSVKMYFGEKVINGPLRVNGPIYFNYTQPKYIEFGYYHEPPRLDPQVFPSRHEEVK